MNGNVLIKKFEQITISNPEAVQEGRCASAVLVPILDRGDHLELILTMRSSMLRHHAGQISFPGGRLDEGETVIEAALRESREEIGLDPDLVTIRGILPGVITAANFHITPVLGIISADPELSVAPAEVERILIEPLAPLLDWNRHARQTGNDKGKPYQTWLINHPSEYIWGATGKMLVQWSEAMFENDHSRGTS